MSEQPVDWTFLDDPDIMAVVKTAVRYHARKFKAARDGREDVDLHPSDIEQDIVLYLATHPKLVASMREREAPRGWYGRLVYDRAVRRPSIRVAMQRQARHEWPIEQALPDDLPPVWEDGEIAPGPYDAWRVRRLIALALDPELLESWRNPYLDKPKDLNAKRNAKADPAHGGTHIAELADIRRAFKVGRTAGAGLTLDQQRVLILRFAFDMTRVATGHLLDLERHAVANIEGQGLARIVHFLNTGRALPLALKDLRHKPHWVAR